MAVILRCIVGVNTSTKRGAKRVGENTKMNSWCTINFIVCKNGQVIKVVKNFLFWQSRLYSNDPCIFQWILPQEIFSKKKKKMHVYRNHKIASFTPPGKKKKSIVISVPKFHLGSLWNVQFNLVLVGHSTELEFIYNSILISSQL